MYLKLLALQKAIKPIVKDSTNPFFKSKYFDINTLIAELKPIINDLGLIIMQPLTFIEGKPGLNTTIIDAESGKILVENAVILPENSDPQKMGSIITYFRRYSLQSLLLLEAEDDDANIAGSYKPESKPMVYNKTPITPEQRNPVLKQFKVIGGKCPDCQTGIIKKSAAGKLYCSDKCWLPENVHLRLKQEVKEDVIDVDDDMPLPNDMFN